MNDLSSIHLAHSALLAPFGIDETALERVFALIRANRADDADLYFQLARSESWMLEEGEVKSGSFSIDQGVGVRVVSGEKTAFAYADDISSQSLEAAARVTRAIAAQGGDTAKVIAADVDAAIVARELQEHRGMNLEARVVLREDSTILAEECDIVAPCATGATLNPRTIPAIRARIVCGAANNQLEDPQRDDRALFERGVLYVADFLTNRMGIVNCADEQYGYVTDDPLIERHLSRDWQHSIHKTCMRVLSESRDTQQPPGKVALGMAEALSLEPHPLTGHRGRQIIASLVADRWQDSTL